MPTLEVQLDDPLVMLRAIRDNIYEETKGLSPEEWLARSRRMKEAFYNQECIRYAETPAERQ